jgi:hypothetical protein
VEGSSQVRSAQNKATTTRMKRERKECEMPNENTNNRDAAQSEWEK